MRAMPRRRWKKFWRVIAVPRRDRKTHSSHRVSRGRTSQGRAPLLEVGVESLERGRVRAVPSARGSPCPSRAATPRAPVNRTERTSVHQLAHAQPRAVEHLEHRAGRAGRGVDPGSAASISASGLVGAQHVAAAWSASKLRRPRSRRAGSLARAPIGAVIAQPSVAPKRVPAHGCAPTALPASRSRARSRSGARAHVRQATARRRESDEEGDEPGEIAPVGLDGLEAKSPRSTDAWARNASTAASSNERTQPPPRLLSDRAADISRSARRSRSMAFGVPQLLSVRVLQVEGVRVTWSSTVPAFEM